VTTGTTEGSSRSDPRRRVKVENTKHIDRLIILHLSVTNAKKVQFLYFIIKISIYKYLQVSPSISKMPSNTNGRKETAEDQHSASGPMCKHGKNCKFVPGEEHAFSKCKPFRETTNDAQCKYGTDCHIIPGKVHAFSACKKIREKTNSHFGNAEKYCEHCDQSVRDHPDDQKILKLCKPRGDHTSAGCRGCWCPMGPKDPYNKDPNREIEIVYYGKPVYKDATSEKFGCGCAPDKYMSEAEAIQDVKKRTEKELAELANITNPGHPVIIGKKIPKEAFPSLPAYAPVDDDEDEPVKPVKPAKPTKPTESAKKNFIDAFRSPAPAAAAAAASSADESVVAIKKESATQNKQVSFGDQESNSNTPSVSEMSDATDTEIHVTPGAMMLLLQYAKANGKILQGKLVDRNGELFFV
jgi:hypothetical protein